MIIEREVQESLKITKKVYQGYGLADWIGRKIFIKEGVPGDIVNVKLTHKKKDVYFGNIIKIIIGSPARRNPDCKVFGKCGGCDWLNMTKKMQLSCKDQIIDDFFGNQQIEYRLPICHTNQEYHYRNKCFYPLSKQSGCITYGMYARYSHQVIKHDICLLQPLIFDKIATDICYYLESAKAEIYNEITSKGNVRFIGFRSDKDQEHIQIILVTRKRKLPFTRQLVRIVNEKYPQVTGIIQNINSEYGNVILDETEKVLYGDNYLSMRVEKKSFQVSYNVFFQVNLYILERILEFCQTHLKGGNCLIDVYCGTGVLGISFANKFKKVIGIDNSLTGIDNARNNAMLNKISNCEFIFGDATEKLPNIIKQEEDVTIIFDPPRKGLTSEIIENMNSRNITRIIYISCNPSTQSRDIRSILKLGYKIKIMQPFDMFPQTWHIENVMILERS